MPLKKFIQQIKRTPQRIYLDHAAATPVHPDVYEAMVPYFTKIFANASAVHKEGQEARAVVDHARKRVAETLSVRSEGVVFTSGGTEANNLALFGSIEERHAQGVAYADMEIVSTKIEHPSIIETLLILAQKGVVIRWVSVTEEGLVDMTRFEESLNEKTILVTCAYVNSEIGVVQPIKQMTRLVRAFNKERGTNILIHTDAAQAPLWLPCALDALGVDMLSLDMGKCYGPKGIGVLAYRHGVTVKPQMGGGPQEHALRPGTENVPLIVGGSLALVRAQDTWESRSETVLKLREYLFEHLIDTIDGIYVNGSREHRVANNVNISLPDIDSEFLVVSLDVAGIAASTKSACSGAAGGGSAVIREMCGDDTRAQSTVRFSMGEETTRTELDSVVTAVRQHVEKMRTFNQESQEGL